MRKLTRRQVLKSAVVIPAVAGCAVSSASRVALDDHEDARVDSPEAGRPRADATVQGDAPTETGRCFPGRVVEVGNPAAVVSGNVQAPVVRALMTRGMLELTGAATEALAWKAFFGPDDVVGIKVNPFGYPNFFTQIATVAEIVRGLGLAGVANENIVVFDRYSDYLAQIGYPAGLPAGVRVEGTVPTTAVQIALDGYDASTYVELPKVEPGLDASVAVNRRSHLCELVSNEVTKVINVPILKDHFSAGVTCALKNITYGSVNNTGRSHMETGNWVDELIPAIAAMPKLRDKVVLHIADLLVAGYAGGPDPSTNTFDYASLLFATDPVALDRIAWQILDAQRAKLGLPPVAGMPDRKPQYVFRCADLGLGIADLAKIDHRVRTA